MVEWLVTHCFGTNLEERLDGTVDKCCAGSDVELSVFGNINDDLKSSMDGVLFSVKESSVALAESGVGRTIIFSAIEL
jgi:hypothetical protein